MMVKERGWGLLIGWLVYNAISAVSQPLNDGKGGKGRRRDKVGHSIAVSKIGGGEIFYFSIFTPTNVFGMCFFIGEFLS